MILSILIPTLPENHKYLERLKMVLMPQVENNRDKVEVLISEKSKDVSTGQKRNNLIRDSSGEYTVFIDDDDWIAPYYVEEILKAAENKPDCITFRGWMTTNGQRRVDFVLRKGEKYEERDGIYYRFPNHITPIKRSITSKISFPEIWLGEDFRWASAINRLNLIRTEVFIDRNMYCYDYWENKLHPGRLKNQVTF